MFIEICTRMEDPLSFLFKLNLKSKRIGLNIIIILFNKKKNDKTQSWNSSSVKLYYFWIINGPTEADTIEVTTM